MIKFIGSSSLFEPSQTGTIFELIHEIKFRGSVSLDIESSGLNYMKDYIILLSAGWHDLQYVIDVRFTDIQILGEIFEDDSILKIFQNSKFDMKFLMRLTNCRFENVYDTMLAEQVLTNGSGESCSLDTLVSRYTGDVMSKEIRSSFHKNPTQLPTLAQIEYSAKDVKYLETIMLAQLQKAAKIDKALNTNTKGVIDLENQFVLALTEIEYEGMSLDIESWKKLAIRSLENLEAVKLILDNIVENTEELSKYKAKSIQLDMFKPESELRKVTINWDSPKQVQEVFSTLLGTTIESVEEKHLVKYKDYLLIYEYIKYKELSKLESSYGLEFLKNLYPDGKIHTEFKQILATGRLSSSFPNVQQIPSTNDYRNCFITNNPNYVFVSCDYSSQELSIIALKSKEEVWIKALKEGKDLHSICAHLIYGEKWEKVALPGCAFMENSEKCKCPEHIKLRTLIKTLNFSLAYGANEVTFSNKANISVGEAIAIIRKYFKAFPRIKLFLDKLGDFAVQRGYTTTFHPFRRIRWFPKAKGNDTKELASIDRRGRNTPIQGCGADMMKLAIVDARNYLRAHPELDVKLVMTVHDQLDSICRRDQSRFWSKKLEEIMENAAKTIFPGGELKAEPNISEKWEK